MATSAPKRRRRNAAIAVAIALASLSAGACAPDPGATANSPNGSFTAIPDSTDFSGASSGASPDSPRVTDTTPTSSSIPSPSLTPGADVLQVGVVVTYSAWNVVDSRVEVSAFAQSFEPAGGTCTLTLTQGNVQRSTQRAAVAGASTTDCGTITIARDKLAGGTWTGVVTFDAAGSAGISTPFAVEVPV